MIIFMIILFQFNHWCNIKQSSSWNLNSATRHESVDVSTVVSKNDQENITKTRIEEKKTFTRFTHSEKCLKCFAKD
jgi:hypothetical protein